METVKIQSLYGQPIFLEQCKQCGGIWFDQSELYRAKPGEAEKIELLDSEMLRTSSNLEPSVHLCPRDQTELFRFTDPYFPKDIIVERCPKCEGFWLNRGEFTRYLKTRQELMRPKEKSPEDIRLENEIKQILESNRTEGADSVLAKLGAFLTTPVDVKNQGVFGTVEESAEEENKLGWVLDILSLLLRLFVFR